MKVPSFGPLEDADCGMCGESKWKLVTRQRLFGEDFQVVRCVGCGLMRTNPRPSPQWKANFYDPRCNRIAEQNGRDFIYDPALDRVYGYRRLLALLKEHVPANARLLDVGCAAGLFVKEARDHGFDATGCDYSARAVAYGKERFAVELIHSAAEAIDAADNSFDVVTILHVFEHLPDPMSVLKELRRVLKMGGLLLLETVNYRAHYEMEKHLRFCIPIYNLITKRSGLPWFPFDHLYHWSPATLETAMKEAGFVDVKLNHLKGYRSEMKPNTGFTLAYAMSEAVAQMLYTISGGQWDFWPVLLATGTKDAPAALHLKS
jgi:2-polyprenyl-3-methyl-5-hydroxy-6-metoxy-1,4-benzoquinol methylase